MNKTNWNMIAGWVLTALIALLGVSIVTSAMFTPKPLATPAYIVQGVAEDAAAPGAAADVEQPITALLASASVERGANQFKKCAACHSIERGGAQGIGPNLWGIVGSKHAHISGFAYSTALQETGDKVWDWDSLSSWVKNPRAYLPGNKMSFAGLSKATDRADLLAYLNTMADSPLPLPAAPVAEVAEAPVEQVVPAGDADPVAVEEIPAA